MYGSACFVGTTLGTVDGTKLGEIDGAPLGAIVGAAEGEPVIGEFSAS